MTAQSFLDSRIASRILLQAAGCTRGLRRMRRPATATGPAFDLAYVRTGPRNRDPARPPVVIIPGGPGLSSILPYGTVRKLAARGNIDLIMVEHRGVGLSRTDTEGRDLPLSAMRIADVVEDIAAVLNYEGVPRANIVGSSYGSYLASSFGAVHPDRVASMLLDSALQSADEITLERAVLRAQFWDSTSEVAQLVRQLVHAGQDQRILLDVVRAGYELGGDRLLLPMLRKRARGGTSIVWRVLHAYASRDGSMARIPGIYEFDLVGELAFRELGYGGNPDGLPFDPVLTYAPLAGRFTPFAGEPFDLREAAAAFDWPLVLLAGTRDLRTPREIAERVRDAAPRAVLVEIDNGHSALDTHPLALLNAVRWLAAGRHGDLPSIEAQLNRLPRRGLVARIPELLARIQRAR